jgi:topoisomerase-4 subunit B
MARVSVEDDGRGIPSACTRRKGAGHRAGVHAPARGGKFDKGKGGAYSFSGGLHGVGVSVTNALAKRPGSTSYRDGQVATMVFSGGDVVEA